MVEDVKTYQPVVDQPDEESDPTSARSNTTVWNQGLWPRFPWQGVLSIIGAVLAILGCLAILVVSDGQPVAVWKIQPAVYLAILVAVTSILTNHAMVVGATHYWWRCLLDKDNTLADAHRRWAQSTSFFAAILAGRHMSIVALATLCVSLVPINGPLLQRASKPTISQSSARVRVSVDAAKELSNGYTGAASGQQQSTSLINPDFLPVVQGHTLQAPIPVNQSGCQGLCTNVTMNGAGFAVTCNSSTIPYVLSSMATPSTADVVAAPGTENGIDAFGVNFTLTQGYWVAISGGNVLNISVQYKDQKACTGYMQAQKCSLTLANVDYPVTIDATTSTILLDKSTTIFDDKVRYMPDSDQWAHIWEPDQETVNNTLGGMWLALSTLYDSSANLRFDNDSDSGIYVLTPQGPLASQYVVSDVNGTGLGTCHMAFRSPMQDLLAATRDVMFRTAVHAANGTNFVVSDATQTLETQVWRSHYEYFAGACVLTCVTATIVLLTFHRYWILGRDVSMSPLEIAKAFGSPLLGDRLSNATVDTLVREQGDLAIKYGVCVQTGTLQIRPLGRARPPSMGESL